MGPGMQEGKMYEEPTTASVLEYSLDWLGRRLHAEIDMPVSSTGQ